MKPTNVIFLFTAAILMSACSSGGGNGNSNSAQSTKSIFSQWQSDGKTIDLTGYSFGTVEPTLWVFQSGSICSSNMIIIGNDSSGTWAISAASAYSGADPGCSQLNGSGTYTTDGTTLSICRTNPSNDCSDWN